MSRVFFGAAWAASWLLVSAPADAQDRKTEKVGAWELLVISDPITDESRSIAIIRGGESSLAVKCDSPGPDSVYVHFIADEYLGEGRYRRRDATHRFGDATPVTQNWNYDGRGAILIDDRAVDQFNGEMLSAERLALRATTFEFRQVTALFSLTPEDTTEAMRRVYSGCNDSLPLLPAPTAG